MKQVVGGLGLCVDATGSGDVSGLINMGFTQYEVLGSSFLIMMIYLSKSLPNAMLPMSNLASSSKLSKEELFPTLFSNENDDLQRSISSQELTNNSPLLHVYCSLKPHFHFTCTNYLHMAILLLHQIKTVDKELH